jgi:lysophospholipase L1-like esterase
MGDSPVRFAFDFGGGPASSGRVMVRPDTVYSDGLGYGFDLGSTVTALDRGGANPPRRGVVTSDRPFFFSVRVPEGNYDVTVVLGGAERESVTTVKAESRRLMLEAVRAARGAFIARTFTVNVRNDRLEPPPENAPGGSRVVLNDRERGVLHWDDKLTLEFCGLSSCVASVDIARASDAVTVFLAGDSTVTDQPNAPYASWGQMLPRFFRPGVAVANHAESGETLKSFITGLRLAKLLGQMKAGDYLFMQFGHNDMKEHWPQTYVEPFTTYKAYLRVFISEARLRGAIPVLVTSMHRRNFDARGKIVNTHGRYPDAMRELSREEGVALIDLHGMSAMLYEALGPEKAPRAFAGDGSDMTHHNEYGAYQLAKCVVEGIRESPLGLAARIVEDFSPYDPSRPEPPESFGAFSDTGSTSRPPRGS